MGKGPEYRVIKIRNINGKQIYEKMLNTTIHQVNANQNHNFTPVRTAIIQRKKSTNTGQGVEKGELLHTVDEHLISAGMENSVENALNTRNRTAV